MPTVDVNVPRFNQAVIAAVTAIAFILNQPIIVAIMFAILAISRFGGPRFALLTQAYVRFIRPRIQPDGPSEFEDARPPAFSQLIGTVFLGASTVALYAGIPVVGWALALIVSALAALAATARICVGCIIYERFLVRVE